MPTIPKCPSCARANALGCNAFGTTIRVPRRTNWPMQHSSLAIGAYALQFSKCPLLIAECTTFNSGSLSEASSTSLVVKALGVALTAINLTYSSELCTCLTVFDASPNSLDSESAMFCLPGKCVTLKLYGCSRSTHLSIQAQGLERGLYMASSGLWSVTSSNYLP